MKPFFISIAICIYMLFASSLAYSRDVDKITIYKGKDNETYDGGDFCKGSGSKCVEMTASELAGVIKFLRDNSKE